MSPGHEAWARECRQSAERSWQRRTQPPKHILTRQNVVAAVISAVVLVLFAYILLVAASLAVTP